jgi:hypothetical protein
MCAGARKTLITLEERVAAPTSTRRPERVTHMDTTIYGYANKVYSPIVWNLLAYTFAVTFVIYLLGCCVFKMFS